MDLPIDQKELREIIIALEKHSVQEYSSTSMKLPLAERLKLVASLIEDGKPYKKILREEFGIVA